MLEEEPVGELLHRRAGPEQLHGDVEVLAVERGDERLLPLLAPVHARAEGVTDRLAMALERGQAQVRGLEFRAPFGDPMAHSPLTSPRIGRL